MEDTAYIRSSRICILGVMERLYSSQYDFKAIPYIFNTGNSKCSHLYNR